MFVSRSELRITSTLIKTRKHTQSKVHQTSKRGKALTNHYPNPEHENTILQDFQTKNFVPNPSRLMPDKVPHNHTRNPPRVPPNRKWKTTIDQSLFRLYIIIAFRCTVSPKHIRRINNRGWWTCIGSASASDSCDVWFIPKDTGGENSFLAGIERHMTVLLK